MILAQDMADFEAVRANTLTAGQSQAVEQSLLSGLGLRISAGKEGQTWAPDEKSLAGERQENGRMLVLWRIGVARRLSGMCVDRARDHTG